MVTSIPKINPTNIEYYRFQIESFVGMMTSNIEDLIIENFDYHDSLPEMIYLLFIFFCFMPLVYLYTLLNTIKKGYAEWK